MQKEIEKIQKIIKNRQQQTAVIIFLYGDLGSGKTTFVQKFSETLNIKKKITSPTYQIRKDYEIKDQNYGLKNLIHIDLYRLKEEKNRTDVLKILDLKSKIKDKTNIIFIEWPDLVEKQIKIITTSVYFCNQEDKYIINIKEQ